MFNFTTIGDPNFRKQQQTTDAQCLENHRRAERLGSDSYALKRVCQKNTQKKKILKSKIIFMLTTSGTFVQLDYCSDEDKLYIRSKNIGI
jgi:hypothetical protein